MYKSEQIQKILYGLALALTTTLATASQGLSLAFTSPNGAVGPTDNIPIWVTSTNTEPLELDLSGEYPYGLMQEYLPKSYQNGKPIPKNTIFSFASFSYSITCECMGNAYLWDFPDPSDPRAFGYDNNGIQLKLDAGKHEYFVGTFKPRGETLPGNYQFNTVQFLIAFIATNPDTGRTDMVDTVLASTCDKINNCGLVRTVVAVPETSTTSQLVIGYCLLAAIQLRLRRRDKALKVASS